MDRFEKIFDYLLKVEGGYSNDKNDRGGKTKYGIIESEARKYGYKGEMRDMPLDIARDIYNKKYYHRNGLDTLKSDKMITSARCRSSFAAASSAGTKDVPLFFLPETVICSSAFSICKHGSLPRRS